MTRQDLLLRAVAGALCFGLVACSDPTSPSGSTVHVAALGPLLTINSRDSEIMDLPAIRVIDVESGSPLSGRDVVFTVETPSGAKQTLTVLTQSDGSARLPSWRTGNVAGSYTATAVVDGWGPVKFTALVPGNVVAIYDLKSINGRPVPYDDSFGREVHYVLYESGHMNRFQYVPDGEFTIDNAVFGTYERPGPSSILLKVDCWQIFQARCTAGRWTAAVSGAQMILEDLDFGPWVELYVLRNP